ncbi:hypothetical protein MGL_3605 [Malassezia globosa CBS 7966]|uniref:Nucleoporin NSP1-like C-terminal domain-containing protein n=1 Tax=Malassezia globosa (strain ATCC MYA-4612 / CBS 7966) TaxID=425265 RepID=A8QA46_MALGO|nr:uncharacterized protein MGL_3605 [Malassezia globosa CBS 7966]EDP41924.1 hypothetical protein MGL_3605 [Malassezia globosa CBS 7966]
MCTYRWNGRQLTHETAFGGTGSSFSFGSSAQSTTADQKPPAFSFGGSTTPAAQPPANLFGSKPSATSAPSSGLFGQAPKPAESSSSAPSQPSTGLFGSAKPKDETKPVAFSFGGKPASSGGFSFGNPVNSNASSTNTAAENTTSSGGGFSFGAKSTDNTAPKPGGFSFGSKPADNNVPKPGGFSFGTQPVDNNAPKPGGFSFGSKPTENNSQSSDPSKPSGFSFGNKPADGNSNSSTTTSTTQNSSEVPKGTGFSFATKPADSTSSSKSTGFSLGTQPAAATNNTQSEAPKSTGFSFGTKPSELKPEDKKDDAKPAGSLFGGNRTTDSSSATSKPAESGGLFGKPPSSNTSSIGGFSFGKSAEANKPDTSSTSAAATATNAAGPKPVSAAPVSAPSLLRGKSMEDIVKMWQDELDASIKEFSQQAGEVAAYDRVLLKGGDEISKLVTQITQAEERQSGIDQTLDYVEQQQAELNALMDTYEQQRKDLLQASGAQTHGRMDMGVADVEREKAYQLAESLNTQLDDMSRNLVLMIDEVNQMSAPTSARQGSSRDTTDANPESLGPLRVGSTDILAGHEDPIMQISAILNAHFSSLKWIDEHTSSLRDRLEALRRGQTEKALIHDTLRSSVGPDSPRSSTPSRSLRESSTAPRSRFLGV